MDERDEAVGVHDDGAALLECIRGHASPRLLVARAKRGDGAHQRVTREQRGRSLGELQRGIGETCRVTVEAVRRPLDLVGKVGGLLRCAVADEQFVGMRNREPLGGLFLAKRAAVMTQPTD